MLTSQSVMAFVATSDGPRAKAFYGDKLGLVLVSDEPFAVVFRAGSTELRVQKVATVRPAEHTVLGWRVPDIVAAVAGLVARGVRFERYESLAQDDANIWTSPSGVKVAWFKDPDGNVLSLTQGVSRPADAIVPEIFVHDGPRAVAFYVAAFGATEISRMMTPDGAKLVHGELEINGHRLFVVDEFPDIGTCKSPRTLGGTDTRITLQVSDADAFVARAVAAGATVMLPVKRMFWGARYGKLRDPFGHEWGVNEQEEVLSPKEEAERARE